MLNLDRLDRQLIAGLTNEDLEVTRLWTLRRGDERYELVLERLLVRSLPILTRVVREEGVTAGLEERAIRLAIEDAGARLLLRLHRRDTLPPIAAVAASIAKECAAAQRPQPFVPRLVPRRPQMRVVRNDWRNS